MTPAVSLALASLVFVGTHLALSHPLRRALATRIGERGFLGLYSVIALAAFGWMILAYRAGDDSDPFWVAPFWWWALASALMLLASILLIGSLIGNPALPRPGGAPRAIQSSRGVFAITRHPMNWSFIIWALVHISISGSARNLIVASAILVLAILGSLGQDRKKARLIGEPWRDWQARTSFIPFAGLIRGQARWRDAAPGGIVVAGGLIVWALATSYHVPVVSPLGDLVYSAR